MGNMRMLRAVDATWALSLCVLTGAILLSSCDDDGHRSSNCNFDCELLYYTACTCGSADPCGWAGDNTCDVYYCASITSDAFDDTLDCGDGGACNGDCGLGVFTECTCGQDDPCKWIGDGYCDTSGCTQVAGDAIFDDSHDCGGDAGTCDGRCAALQYTECTCGVDDPCGWAGDGNCDLVGCFRVVGDAAFNDTADCQGSSGDLSFGVTAVRDDLDNGDMSIISDGLSQLGYQLSTRDVNVTTSSLASYLTQDLTTLYHTGHGFEEGIATSDGVLYLNQISLNVRNTIMATCLALAERWDGCFGSSAETVLGYNKVSFDFIDNDVANQFLAALGNGSSYPQAWYVANSGIFDVSDRWVAYVREGGNIVEYSARSGATPQADGSSEGEHLFVASGRSSRLHIAQRLIEDQQSYPVVGVLGAVIESQPSSPEGGFLEATWPRFAQVRLSREEARGVAEVFIESRLGGLPPDASLDRISEITARVVGEDDEDPISAGFIVRFGRRIDGVAVRGNRVADHITVLVGSEGVVAWTRYWPNVVVEHGRIRALWSGETLLTVGEAVALAADSISRSVKGELSLVSARAVYGTPGPGRGSRQLLPAYEFLGDHGSSVVVDALTGHVMR